MSAVVAAPPVGAGSPASWLKIPPPCQLFLPTTANLSTDPLLLLLPLDRKEGQCVLLVPKKHSCKGIALRCKVVLQLVGSGRSFGRLVGLVGGPAMASCCNAVVLPSSGSAEVGEDTNQHRRRSRQSNFSAAAPLQEAPVREPRKRSHLLLSIVDESSSYLVGPDWQTKFEVRWRQSGAASVAFFPLRLLLLVSSLPWPVACHGSTCQQPV